MVKYNTPYLMRDSSVYTKYEHKKAYPVYVDDIDGSDISLKMFNEDETKVINEIAWYGPNDLIPYTEENRKRIQAELDEYYDQDFVTLHDIIKGWK